MNLDRHNNIHVYHRNVNYVLLENCPHCKLERRLQYGNIASANNLYNQYSPLIISPLIIRPLVINERRNNNYMIYDNLDYYDLEDVEILTLLRSVNKNSKIYNYMGDSAVCIICLERLKKLNIIRELYCGHFFHYKCIDKWLENHKKCPLCNKELTS